MANEQEQADMIGDCWSDGCLPGTDECSGRRAIRQTAE